jgi:hypothetical protein
MFGLMKAKKCGMSKDEKDFRRLNYCGTCKTIGSLYGQKSRFLLNHDTVFLAEILTAMSGQDGSGWQRAYQSYNCLSLPKENLPQALQFAATTNIILTEFKLADHLADEGKRVHKFAKRAFSKEFQIAEKYLKEWKFPLEKVRQILAKQTDLESTNSNKSLDFFAEPTAKTTALFFAEGVKLIGQKEFADSVYEIGFEFGKLIYLLDAFEDYEKDFRTNQFNAIRKSFGLETDQINAATKRKVVAVIKVLESRIIEHIYQLPISDRKRELFSSRLNDNLRRKLKTNLPVIQTKKVCSPKPKPTFSKRWQNSVKTAGEFARSYSWQMPFVFLFILTMALVAPAQTKEARSARECFDLSFNLMFLGGGLGSVFAFAKPIFANQDPGKIYPDLAEQKKKQQQDIHGQEDSWCDCCTDCDCWCDGCDCCDGCGCCDGCCCCDSCDCDC